MKYKLILFLVCTIPTLALGYNDKYDSGGSGKEFILYIAIVGGIMLINWIRARFGNGKD